MKRITLLAISAIVAVTATAQQVGFRGENHSGIYPNEKNLLKEWPAGGPEKLWVVNDAGKGNSSAIVVDGKIYTSGLTEDEQNEQITCFNLDGTVVYQVVAGRAWTKSFQETRCTPLIEDDRIYFVSGMGECVCLNRADGKILWKNDFWAKYEITPNDQGICEQVLVDKNRVIVTVNGKEVCMVAYDKFTGETLWETPGLGDVAQYMASRIIEWNGHRLVVAGSEAHIYGIDPETGKMVWADDKWVPQLTKKEWYFTMINAPIFKDGYLLISQGDRHGCHIYKVADDLSSVEYLYKNRDCDFYIGGMVEVDGIVYGSAGGKNEWSAVDLKTGETRYHEAWAGGKARGALIMADGMFYMFDERRNFIGLANINPDKLDVVSEFQHKDGAGAFFSHPTIFDGVLYVRRGTALTAYKIK